ncbi:MAG: orotidine-5'-phosphate decarboxylase [Candidatus Omnitrophota bacterium]|jgi:orotidine-5'-phosphate decarboxylase
MSQMPSSGQQPAAPELILALDVDTISKAHNFISILYPQVKIFKVGLQLFTQAGPSIIEYIRKKGAGVFLDLKFHDIPNTVACAVRQAVGQQVEMMTLHASGGAVMLQAASRAATEESEKLKIRKPVLLGVTVLTSQEAAPGEVLRLAAQSLESGLGGVVCSVREAAFLRGELKQQFVIVTPGIRPDIKSADDQKRTATVAEAVKAGSDFLVVGRPILEAADPLKAVEEYLRDIHRKA